MPIDKRKEKEHYRSYINEERYLAFRVECAEAEMKILWYQDITSDSAAVLGIDPVVEAYAIVLNRFGVREAFVRVNSANSTYATANNQVTKAGNGFWQKDLPYGGVVLMLFSYFVDGPGKLPELPTPTPKIDKPKFRITGTITGRFSSKESNLTEKPRSSEKTITIIPEDV